MNLQYLRVSHERPSKCVPEQSHMLEPIQTPLMQGLLVHATES